jgi:HNH endonuclease
LNRPYPDGSRCKRPRTRPRLSVPPGPYLGDMPKVCAVADCERAHYSRSYCEMHYRRALRNGGRLPPEVDRRSQPCAVEVCEHMAEAKGFCHGHYQRLLRTGTVMPTSLNNVPRTCSVDGCNRPHKAKGFCPAHYKRVLVTGDPQPTVPIRRANRMRGEGTIKHGYLVVPVPEDLRHLSDAATTHQHRLIMAQAIGRALLPDEQVHHRNGDRLDNRLSNLELWSTSHPSGARIEDLIEFAYMILIRYAASGLSRRLIANLSASP